MQLIFPTEASTPGYHLDGSYSNSQVLVGENNFTNGDLQLIVLAVCAVIASLFALVTAKINSIHLSNWGNFMVYCIVAVLITTIWTCIQDILFSPSSTPTTTATTTTTTR